MTEKTQQQMQEELFGRKLRRQYAHNKIRRAALAHPLRPFVVMDPATGRVRTVVPKELRDNNKYRPHQGRQEMERRFFAMVRRLPK